MTVKGFEMSDKLSIVMVGAHPDDCEIFGGGMAVKYRALGHDVSFVSVANGNAGHHELSRDEIRRRRYEETRRVAGVLDINYEVMDIDDGAVEPTVANRENLIRILRKYQPDLILTHRPDDYHPDHRYTSQLVSDTAYILAVPLCVPDVPALNKPVVYGYFTFKPDLNDSCVVLVPVDDVMEKKLLAVHQHTSQMYEWLPWIDGIDLSKVPSDDADRLKFLSDRMHPFLNRVTVNFREKLKMLFSKGSRYSYVEAVRACPYGEPLTRENARKLFPFKDVVIY